MNILGIETSCDDTAAAVVADGTTIKSSVVASQIKVHQPYGGVVPELASRNHIEAVVPVVQQALTEAECTTAQLDAVAVTRGPGLVGSLLVGFSFAKAFAYAAGLPWVGVNHLQGHINALFLEPEIPRFPFVALLASGGHTAIYHVTSHVAADLMGQTRDDAAGEAFDKVAKMLGLGYPGGKVIDALALEGDARAIAFPRPFLDKDHYDFSFSGLKSAVSRYIQTFDGDLKAHQAHIVASFREAAVDVLVHKLLRAAREKQCSQVAVVGGVAANARLRERVRSEAAAQGLEIFIPSMALCGDNAAMIAAAGYHHLVAGTRSDLATDVYSRAESSDAGPTR
jgi:N6-L-threonylcarbamoyladenine synthase